MQNNTLLEKNILDFSSISTPSDILLELSQILESNTLTTNRVKLFLGDVSLTPSHIFGIKSLLANSDISIEMVYTNSVHTQLAVLGAGLAVSENLSLDEISNESKEIDLAQELEMESEQISEEIEFKTQEESFEDITQEDIEYQKDNSTEIETIYLKQTLRSGQSLKYDGNIVIIGDCHPGSEVIASGDITVWGVLSGIAHAGNKGNYNACIRALKISAIQLRIADLYSRKPDSLILEKIEKTSTFTPEEAKITDGEIIIYSLNG